MGREDGTYVSPEQLKEEALQLVRESRCVMIFALRKDGGCTLGVLGSYPDDDPDIGDLMNGSCQAISTLLDHLGRGDKASAEWLVAPNPEGKHERDG